jgi:hypothetical protein
VNKLEDVFKRSGIPTHTFVQPIEYQSLLVAIRTPGRAVIVEGPSGIGKTTSVFRVLDELGLAGSALKLSARRPDDVDLIAGLPGMKSIGLVVVDDFHKLPAEVKASLADYVKTLADAEDATSKIVIIGINRAGDALLKFASDLAGRIDTFRLESNPEERVKELVELGERALGISIGIKDHIVQESRGSFHIAQMLCYELCILCEVIEEVAGGGKEVTTSAELLKQKVHDDLFRVFGERARLFASGGKLRREGRAPYLFLLHWLGTEDQWALQLDEMMRKYPDHRASVGQIVDKGYLVQHLERNPDLGDLIHFDGETHVLSVEDPKFVFFLKNLLWSKFAQQVGYRLIQFRGQYDFALSFAGSDRHIAEAIFNALQDRDISVFYDFNEQHRIISQYVEDYLAPIYRSEAAYVVPILGLDYPKRIWTKFESEQFKHRFGEGAVIPIFCSDVPVGMFDEAARVGGIVFNRDAGFEGEINRISEILAAKLREDRSKELDETKDGGV